MLATQLLSGAMPNTIDCKNEEKRDKFEIVFPVFLKAGDHRQVAILVCVPR